MSQSPNYERTPEELESVASKFWPSEISEKEAKLSIIPLLLETQDQFINIIGLKVPNLNALFTIVQTSCLSANLFLKHLVILADYGGEMLKRVSREFQSIFPNNTLYYNWNGEKLEYQFKALPNEDFSNKTLGISGKELLKKDQLSNLQRDAIALLLFGSNHSGSNQELDSILSKCEIGEYLGKPNELAAFIKQRYIWVSRITGGAKSNTLGQIAQEYVAKYISDNLRLKEIEVIRSGHLPGVTHTDGKQPTSFDLVVKKENKYVAIEVSFQVTTNSVIERKAGQARARFEQIKEAGHKIAYVLDGAGNFERKAALTTICSYSHCTVAFSESELKILCEFLKSELCNLK